MIRDFKFDLQRFDSAFSGGNGTEKDPYKISNLADLEQFKRDVNGGNNYSGKYLKVTNDITLTRDTWTPIGVFGKSFSGTFDGDGHTISGLTAMHENHDLVDGFFGYTNGGATIKNVHLTNVSIRSDYYTIGALVADVNDGTQIINCSVQGNVEVGGIGVHAGGLVGDLWSGSMKNCAFLGTFKIIGQVNEVGIIASLSPQLDGNYYLGDYDNLNPNGATRIYKATVPDNVTSSAIVSFVGKDYIKKGEVTFDYLGGTYKYNVNGDVTLTLKDNKLFANDTDLGAVFPATLDGDGSQNNPFLIKSEEHLRLLATYVNYGNNCAGLNFKLDDDINLTSNWIPIGDSKNNFSGTFDGDGKTISKLKINDATSDGQGLFGFTNNATIKNVNLTGVNVTGKNLVGALIGSAAGKTQVTNCSASGTVKGSENIGGLVGSNSGTIKNSALLGGTVVGTTKGAIAGKNSGTLTDNYYLGDLNVDSNGATKIFKLVAPGNVTSSAIVTLNGMKYVKAGDATFNFNGKTYNYNVTDDLAIAVEGNNLSFSKLDTAENFLSTFDGNGSEKNPYLIKTESHLRQLATYVNYGNNCAEKNFKLANDIALTSNWIPIGNSSNKFKGAFDGGGKTVSNLTINDTTSDFQGLFGYTNGATIKNFNLTGVNVTGKNNVGALVGNAAGKTQVSNCSVQGTVKGSENVGGLVGSNSGTIKDSALLNGTIDGNTRGAIVGKNSGTIKENFYFGALAEGVNDNSAQKIFNVNLPEGVTSNEVVTFNGTKYIKAGDVTFNFNGKNYSFNVANETTVTINDGKLFVNNTNPEANFPGNLDGDGSASNPYIIKTENHLRQLATYVNAGNNCKGLNFKLANDIALTSEWTAIGANFNRTFNGNFDGDGHTISNLTADDNSMNYQGLFGNIDNATIKNVHLTGVNFRGKYRVSSLVGSANNNSQILNCSASGNLKSNGLASYLGGIVGYINGDTTVDGCTFRGNIEGLKLPKLILFGSHVGGIVGVYNSGTVKNCAYLGGTLSSSNSGAIVSISRDDAFIDNYYLGKLGEGVKDSGATQIFNVSLPEGVTSTAVVTLNGTKYIKAGDATFNFNGGNYNYKVAGDVTVTIQDSKIFVDGKELTSAPKLVTANENSMLQSSANVVTFAPSTNSLWGNEKSDALIYGGGSFKTNGLDDIIATNNAGNNYVSADSFALKNFMTKTFAGNNDALTLSGGAIKK